jgi:hypothetical protein
VLSELSSRRTLIQEAAALGVARLDELVAALYDGTFGLAGHLISGDDAPEKFWESACAMLTTLEHALIDNEAGCERILLQLGVSRTTGWSVDEATPLCCEVRRTALEGALKLKLRLWFSNREQSVWRTLHGRKGSPAR